jgi:hypothetical protein
MALLQEDGTVHLTGDVGVVDVLFERVELAVELLT